MGSVDVMIDNPSGPMPVRYLLQISERGQQADIVQERLENQSPLPGHTAPYFFFEVSDGRGRLTIVSQEGDRRTRPITPDDVDAHQSILHEFKDPTQYPEVTFVGRRFDAIRLYREWNLGRSSAIKRPQPTDAPNAFLEESLTDLALILNQLQLGPWIELVEEQLRRFYDMYEHVQVNIHANTAQLWVLERD